MRIAYVDTSCLVAIAFGERGATAIRRRLSGYDELFSSNLLEAELRASFAREKVTARGDLLSWISWILPDRTIPPEIGRVLRVGHVRSADL